MIDLSPGGLEDSKGDHGQPRPKMYPLVKMEYIYEDDSDSPPLPPVITKEISFTATELTKLRKDFVRTARESETQSVLRVSLSEEMGSCCRKGKRKGTGAQACYTLYVNRIFLSSQEKLFPQKR